MKHISITKYIYCFTINKYTQNFLVKKTSTDHWSKPQSILDTNLGVYLFFDSEPYLGRSEESNNQGIKIQVKSRECQCAAGASNPHFKINVSLFCCPLFFNPQVRINKVKKIVTCQLSALGLLQRMHPVIFLYTPLGFHFSINVIFSQTCIYHHACEKCSNLWCSGKWKMDLRVKKLKQAFLLTPSKTLSPVPIITSRSVINYSFPQLRERTKKIYFKMYCFQ